jgi:hypothetical protein
MQQASWRQGYANDLVLRDSVRAGIVTTEPSNMCRGRLFAGDVFEREELLVAHLTRLT